MDVQWFVTAVIGGFWGVTLAVIAAFFVVRAVIVRALTESSLLKKAHEENQCPVCKRSMRHEHRFDYDEVSDIV
jgi:hypothetical protein